MGTGIQTRTLILVTTAAILGGGLYFFEKKVPPLPSQEVTGSSRPIFNVQESQITALSITNPRETIRLERDDAGAWQLTAPQTGPAAAGTVVFLLNLLSTAKTEKTLTIPLAQAEEFGLAQPTATIDITLADKTSHRLVLGGSTFDQNQLYAQADPPVIPNDPLKVIVVPLEFLNSVNQPLSQWQQQPDEPSPSPTSIPSP